MNVCKHKDEEECQKKGNFFPKDEYYIEYEGGFFIRTHPCLIDSPIAVTFGTSPKAKMEER